eukprot:m.82400 g.82400  ORF g.82400 m.82400 type:complete len:54 (+) comp12688_c0_seq4:1320-1481(+)
MVGGGGYCLLIVANAQNQLKLTPGSSLEACYLKFLCNTCTQEHSDTCTLETHM